MNYESDYIKNLYENLSEKKQIEISDYLRDTVKEELIEILEKKEFIGVDNSLEVSLFEYDIVYREKDGLSIRYQNNIYDYCVIENDDLLEMINDMESGFFDWLGCTKEYYIKWFNEESNKSMFINDIFKYCDKLYERFNLADESNDIVRIISLLESERE